MIAALALAAAAAGRPPRLPEPLPPPEPIAVVAEGEAPAPVLLFPPPAPVIVPAMLVLAPPRPGLTDEVRLMIASAYKSGNDKTIDAVVGIAKSNFPQDIPTIDQVASVGADELDQVRRDEHEREQARIAAARFFQIWKGQVEAGGSWNTGTTRVLGLYAAANLTRDGIRWRQRFNGRIDIQRTNGQTTTERWLAAWQPTYKLNDRLYTFALIQYEHDRFLGYDARGTLGTGLGYNVVNRPGLKIDVEGGPALRHTNYEAPTIPNRTRVAGRASTTINWALSPRLSLTQTASGFLEGDDATFSSNTALDTKLIGDLKGRISYNVQFEERTPLTDRQLDTITRATLVYNF